MLWGCSSAKCLGFAVDLLVDALVITVLMVITIMLIAIVIVMLIVIAGIMVIIAEADISPSEICKHFPALVFAVPCRTSHKQIASIR